MTARGALRRAVRDLYDQSWRLLILNTLLGFTAVGIAWAALHALPALLLGLLLGPPAAALMHCAITLVREGDLRLADAFEGLRLHWRRGLALGALAGAAAVLTVVALRFYAGAGPSAWPLAMLVLYLALLFAVFQLPLWTLAILEHEQPLRRVLADAGLALLRRPAAWTGLAVVLFLVNLSGIAAAVLPFLTLTIAYSFLAAARFALPRDPTPEA